MALSEREQRLLEEMERNLYQNEADVLTTLGQSRRAPNYTAIVIGVVVAVAGIGLMIAGVNADLTWLGIVGFAVLFTGVMVAVAVPGPELKLTPGSAGGKKPTGSLMDRLNERWERRQGGEGL